MYIASPTVDTDPSRTQLFEDALQTGRVLKRHALRLSVDGEHFENGGFRKR